MLHKIANLSKSILKNYRDIKLFLTGNQYAKNYNKKYSVPKLTNEQKKEIQDYWKQYGIKVKDFCWYQMFYFATGINDPRFVPDPIGGNIVYPYYNDYKYLLAWRDKNMFDRLLPNMPFPKTICKVIRNRFYYNGEYHPKQDGLEKASEWIFAYCKEFHCEVIFKASRDTGFGKSVKKYRFSTITEVREALTAWKNVCDYIVQECVEQHEVLSSFNESSCNMIRVYSWRHDVDVDIIFMTARVGIPGSVTDVAFINGEERVNLIGITEDGYFCTKMLNQDGMLVRTIPNGIKVPCY